ncbi:MAG: hypothetical protein RLZZ476_2634, partial [Verrucomicrobiota bacterium]
MPSYPPFSSPPVGAILTKTMKAILSALLLAPLTTVLAADAPA